MKKTKVNNTKMRDKAESVKVAKGTELFMQLKVSGCVDW